MQCLHMYPIEFRMNIRKHGDVEWIMLCSELGYYDWETGIPPWMRTVHVSSQLTYM